MPSKYVLLLVLSLSSSIALSVAGLLYTERINYVDFAATKYGFPFWWLIHTTITFAGITDIWHFEASNLVENLVLYFLLSFGFWAVILPSRQRAPSSSKIISDSRSSIIRNLIRKAQNWLILCFSWAFFLPTLISPLWTISGFLFWMFVPLGMYQGLYYLFYVFLNPQGGGGAQGWEPWLRFYVPWIPLIQFPAAWWLIDNRISIQNQGWAKFLDIARPFLIVLGLTLLVVGLAQIVYGKLRGKGLIANGLYSLVRHPQYLGIIIWTLGLTLYGLRAADFIAWSLLAFLYLLLAESEERKLQREYAEQYALYREKTPFILPFLSPRYFRWLTAALPKKKWKRILFSFFAYASALIIMLIVLKAITTPT